MKLKNIINEGDLSNRVGVHSLSLEETKETIRNKCPNNFSFAKKNEYFLYRGANYSDQDFLLVDPSQRTRTSLTNRNYHNWFIDNFPQWQKFPKRSKSINTSAKMDDISLFLLIQLNLAFALKVICKKVLVKVVSTI